MSAQWRDLAGYMSDISERAYCAEWIENLEYYLWRILLGGEPRFGQTVVTDEEVNTLRRLSEAAGGWVRFGDQGEEFVPAAQWPALYRAWEEKRALRSR